MKIALVVLFLLCGVALSESSPPPTPSAQEKKQEVLRKTAPQKSLSKLGHPQVLVFSSITAAYSQMHTDTANNQKVEESLDKNCRGWLIRFNKLYSNAWGAIFTGGLLIVAGFQLKMFINQLALMGNSLDEARTASEAAKCRRL